MSFNRNRLAIAYFSRARLGLLFLVLSIGLPATSLACGGDSPAATTTQVTQEATARAAGNLTALLATTDLAVGPNRVSFLLTSPKALVTAPKASIASYYVEGDGSLSEVVEQVDAPFYLWPYGTRGNYVTQLTFDRPGRWQLEVKVPQDEGGTGMAYLPLEVKESGITPALGALPPALDNKTARDVASLEELTSWSTPDPELYQQTLAEAVTSQRPTVVVFSSPAFCTSPTCGPQVEALQQLKEQYRDQANFIHIEVYDNPLDIQGDFDRARYASIVEAWNLPAIEGYLNESWTFVLDRDGRITAKYEGFASQQELEDGLLAVL